MMMGYRFAVGSGCGRTVGLLAEARFTHGYSSVTLRVE